MLNFNPCFLAHATTLQAHLHNVIFSLKFKGSQPVTWFDALILDFNECNARLSRSALLSHPHPTAPLALFTVGSTTATGTIQKEWVQVVWQPLAFFSRKLSPAQEEYSAYDKEILVI